MLWSSKFVLWTAISSIIDQHLHYTSTQPSWQHIVMRSGLVSVQDMYISAWKCSSVGLHNLNMPRYPAAKLRGVTKYTFLEWNCRNIYTCKWILKIVVYSANENKHQNHAFSRSKNIFHTAIRSPGINIGPSLYNQLGHVLPAAVCYKVQRCISILIFI